MQLTEVELRRTRLPLVTPFRTSQGTQRERESLLVRVAGDLGDGWGECAALTEPLYTSEYVEGTHHVTRHHLLPRLWAHGDVAGPEVGAVLGPVKGHSMAKAALEMAVLDAELRAEGRSLAGYLGAVREAVDAGVALGVPGSVPELLDHVAACLEAGYLRVKLKVGPGWDVEPVRAVREHFGDDVLLQVDANGAYTLADADHLCHLDAFGLAMVEQPLAADDLPGHAELARRLHTPICLDESITSAAAAATAISLGAAAVVTVKPGRVGGLLEARRVHDVCTGAGIPAWCGGMLETGLGRAANLALAALPGFTLPSDLSASDRYYRVDLTEPFVLEAGRLRVPTGLGIGVQPLPDVLEEHTTSVERLRPG